MRTARRKTQRMFYSNFHVSEPVYLTDDEGNIVYRTMPDGEQVAVKDGETKEGHGVLELDIRYIDRRRVDGFRRRIKSGSKDYLS